MANTYVTIAGLIWHPMLPMPAERFYVGNERRMLSGNLRRAHRATKRRWGPYERKEATATERTTVENAIVYSASFTFTDETATGRTVMLAEYSYELHRSEPDVEDATSGTGDVFYTLRVVLEEV